jgi:hypothetical protein
MAIVRKPLAYPPVANEAMSSAAAGRANVRSATAAEILQLMKVRIVEVI